MMKRTNLWSLWLLVFILLPGFAHAKGKGDREAFIGITPISAQAPVFLATPWEVGMILGENWTISLDYGWSSFDFNHDEEEEHGNMMGNGGSMSNERWELWEGELDQATWMDANGNYKSQGVKLRMFLTDSLNLLVALHERQFNANLGGPTTGQGKVNAKAQVASLGIGSQWFLDAGLVVGVDWAVGSSLIGQSVSTSWKEEPTSLTTAEQDTALAEMRTFGESANALSARSGGFNLFIGWSF